MPDFAIYGKASRGIYGNHNNISRICTILAIRVYTKSGVYIMLAVKNLEWRGVINMIRSYVGLLASVLPATLFVYLVGVIFLKRLKSTNITIMVGFFIAWFLAAIISLFMANQATVNSAREFILPATVIGVLITIFGIVIVEKRKVSEK